MVKNNIQSVSTDFILERLQKMTNNDDLTILRSDLNKYKAKFYDVLARNKTNASEVDQICEYFHNVTNEDSIPDDTYLIAYLFNTSYAQANRGRNKYIKKYKADSLLTKKLKKIKHVQLQTSLPLIITINSDFQDKIKSAISMNVSSEVYYLQQNHLLFAYFNNEEDRQKIYSLIHAEQSK